MLCRRWPSDPGSVKAGTDPGVVGVQGLSLEETATVEDLLAAAAAGRPLNMPLSPTREDSREGELESEDSRAAAAFGSIPSMRSPEQHAGGHGSATQELSTGGMSGVSAAWTATRAGNPGPYRDPQVSHDSRVSPAVYEETGARLYARAAEMRARAEARALAAAAEQDGRRHFVASIDVQPRVFNASEPKHAKHLPTGMEECTFHPRYGLELSAHLQHV